MNIATEQLNEEGMLQRYKEAVEKVLPRLPVKNGVVDIDSLWVELSIPYSLLREIISRKDLALPDNVKRIEMKSCLGEESEKTAGQER
ncbi:MAG: hypothetical protein V3V77_01950 [Candidatus Bipolaricaulota bacterium]